MLVLQISSFTTTVTQSYFSNINSTLTSRILTMTPRSSTGSWDWGFVNFDDSVSAILSNNFIHTQKNLFLFCKALYNYCKIVVLFNQMMRVLHILRLTDEGSYWLITTAALICSVLSMFDCSWDNSQCLKIALKSLILQATTL